MELESSPGKKARVEREAAWVDYREAIRLSLWVTHPEASDLRLAFEAGYAAGYEAGMTSVHDEIRADTFGTKGVV